MPHSAFINFIFLLLQRHRSKHVAVFVIATIIVFLFSAVMFLSDALHKDISVTLDDQADFIVQKIRGGKAVDAPADWALDFAHIEGVRSAIPRVYGRYFYEPNGTYFTVVGVDLFDAQISGSLEKLVAGLDIRKFMTGNNMIIGSGVQEFLADFRYSDSYDFKTPDQNHVEVAIFDTFASESDLVSNDLVIMEIDLARQVLGIGPEMATDIVLYVPNELEGDSVMVKVIQKHFDIRVIQKKEIAMAYKNLFNYKGGVFLVMFMIVLITFVLILYQRYSMITGSDRREIGILRAVGWSIKDVIALKVAESMVVALGAFFLGVILAYGFVFILHAPLLGAVFFGYANMPVDFSLTRSIDLRMISLLFLFFMVPFTSAVLVPVWRIAIIDPVEAMK
jgi:putative ABC transport system permease protein